MDLAFGENVSSTTLILHIRTQTSILQAFLKGPWSRPILVWVIRLYADDEMHRTPYAYVIVQDLHTVIWLVHVVCNWLR